MKNALHRARQRVRHPEPTATVPKDHSKSLSMKHRSALLQEQEHPSPGGWQRRDIPLSEVTSIGGFLLQTPCQLGLELPSSPSRMAEIVCFWTV
jgi:hypothetical protein